MGLFNWLGLKEYGNIISSQTASHHFAFILDGSPSMFGHDMNGGSRYKAAMDAFGALAEKVSKRIPDGLVSVVVFWEDATIYIRPQEINTLFFARVVLLEKHGAFGSGTSLGKGLQKAYEVFGGFSSIPNLRAIALTDGESNAGPNAVEQATLLKDSGVQIDVIGFAGWPGDVNEYELRQVATTDADGQNHYWFIDNVPDLIARFEDLALREIAKASSESQIDGIS